MRRQPKTMRFLALDTMINWAIQVAKSVNTARLKTYDLLELVVGYVLILLTIWTSGSTQQALLITSATWIVMTTFLLPDKTELSGLRPSGLEHSWWIIVAAAGMAAVAVGIAARMGTLHLPPGFARHAWRAWAYVAFAFVQQFILQNYFLLRLRHLVSKTYIAVGIAALLFSLAHLPNPLLTLTTLVWGLVACLLFLRCRDLYALALAHAILGLGIAFTIPNAIHHQMRVGLGYLTYQSDVRAHSVEPKQPNSIHASMGDH